jgi:hypothetical protein
MHVEKVWTEIATRHTGLRTAENGLFSLSFSGSRLTGAKRQDCYTFEYFASSPDEIRNAYYYHYKRTRFVLKEETKWS